MQLPQNIMIVEDEVLTQRYLKDILLHNGVKNIVCYDNAKDVLKHMKTTQPNMILMDVDIIGPVDGIQLSRKISEMNQNIPIIFITAHCDEHTFDEVLELSPYGFISKPFSSKDIEVTLRLAYKRYLVQQEMLRYKNAVDNIDTVFINQQYKYSKSLKTLYKNNQPVKLKKKHQLLVDALCTMHNQIITFDVLTEKIWGEKSISDSALRTLIYTLRQILPDLPIISYSKVGYSLETK